MTVRDKYFCINGIHSCVLQTSTVTGGVAMTWTNVQSINNSIELKS